MVIPKASSAIRSEAALERLERLTEFPLLILAIIMVPLLAGPLLWDLTAEEEAIFLSLDTLIWAVFAVDLGAKVLVAPDRFAYLKAHRLEVLVVLIPFARPLRIVRLFVFGSRAFVGARRFASIDFLLLYAIGFVVLASTALTTIEQGKESSVSSFPDALWWSVVTITTVGYGDVVPVTAAGRAFAMVLMIAGIGIFGGLTANLASFFVTSGASDANRELAEEVRALRQELQAARSAPDAG